MREYYRPNKPVYRYFQHLENVLGGLGASYHDGSAAHLDLVQEATQPAWSKLRRTSPEEHAGLHRMDFPFLRFQLASHTVAILLCNGKTVSREIQSLLPVQLVESGEMKRICWWLGQVALDGRKIALAGWNYPLDKPTGLGKAGEHELGQLICERLNLSGA